MWLLKRNPATPKKNPDDDKNSCFVGCIKQMLCITDVEVDKDDYYRRSSYYRLPTGKDDDGAVSVASRKSARRTTTFKSPVIESVDFPSTSGCSDVTRTLMGCDRASAKEANDVDDRRVGGRAVRRPLAATASDESLSRHQKSTDIRRISSASSSSVASTLDLHRADVVGAKSRPAADRQLPDRSVSAAHVSQERKNEEENASANCSNWDHRREDSNDVGRMISSAFVEFERKRREARWQRRAEAKRTRYSFEPKTTRPVPVAERKVASSFRRMCASATDGDRARELPAWSSSADGGLFGCRESAIAAAETPTRVDDTRPYASAPSLVPWTSSFVPSAFSGSKFDLAISRQ